MASFDEDLRRRLTVQSISADTQFTDFLRIKSIIVRKRLMTVASVCDSCRLLSQVCWWLFDNLHFSNGFYSAVKSQLYKSCLASASKLSWT